MNARGLLVLPLLALAGCASNSIVGTWSGRAPAGAQPFSFGSVTFVGDNTFTAEARYGNEVRVQSGTWSADGDNLRLSAAGAERSYTYRVGDDELVVTDPESKNSITLDRMKK
jgi:hypothetical protein